MHWLILIPCYFFGAMSLLALFMLCSRLLRLRLPIDWLVGIAIAVAAVAVVAPLALGVVDLHAVSGRAVLVVGLASFVLTGIDVAVARLLPLPLDRDIERL
ncbi:hypothetical protein L6Q96_09890 [Candidatus Binatia bacterium]|nr:hypothetical protein [Candidatus Binatia bacterium]